MLYLTFELIENGKITLEDFRVLIKGKCNDLWKKELLKKISTSKPAEAKNLLSVLLLNMLKCK